jgi:hypothetical protein
MPDNPISCHFIGQVLLHEAGCFFHAVEWVGAGIAFSVVS